MIKLIISQIGIWHTFVLKIIFLKFWGGAFFAAYVQTVLQKSWKSTFDKKNVWMTWSHLRSHSLYSCTHTPICFQSSIRHFMEDRNEDLRFSHQNWQYATGINFSAGGTGVLQYVVSSKLYLICLRIGAQILQFLVNLGSIPGCL